MKKESIIIVLPDAEMGKVGPGDMGQLFYLPFIKFALRFMVSNREFSFRIWR